MNLYPCCNVLVQVRMAGAKLQVTTRRLVASDRKRKPEYKIMLRKIF